MRARQNRWLWSGVMVLALSVAGCRCKKTSVEVPTNKFSVTYEVSAAGRTDTRLEAVLLTKEAISSAIVLTAPDRLEVQTPAQSIDLAAREPGQYLAYLPWREGQDFTFALHRAKAPEALGSHVKLPLSFEVNTLSEGMAVYLSWQGFGFDIDVADPAQRPGTTWSLKGPCIEPESGTLSPTGGWVAPRELYTKLEDGGLDWYKGGVGSNGEATVMCDAMLTVERCATGSLDPNLGEGTMKACTFRNLGLKVWR